MMSTVGKGAKDLDSPLIRTQLATPDRIPAIRTMTKDTLQVGQAAATPPEYLKCGKN